MSTGPVHIDGAGADEPVALRLPLAAVRWPERTRHGARVAHLEEGGSVRALDAAAWDAWARASGLGESVVVRAQQSWRGALVAVGLLLGLAAASYAWVLPWLARAVLAASPAGVDGAIGDAALGPLGAALLLPSQVPVARQQAIRDAFVRAVERTDPPGARPAWQLRFHTSPKQGPASDAKTRLGPNAFALPGGTVVVTDEMLTLLQGRDDVSIGVLGHELGHVRHRHGMRLLVQATVIATAASIAWGDFSAVLAAAPVMLGQRGSRDFEREADDDAVRLLRANGLSPAVMVELFERLRASRTADGSDAAACVFELDLGIALASHPADAERMARFRAGAAQ